MPPAIAAITAYLTPIVGGFWAGVIAQAVVIVAEVAVLSAISKKPKLPGYLSELQDRHHVIRSAVAPHRVVLGQSITSGPLCGAFSKPGPTDIEHEILYLAVALAGHECQSIDTILLNNKSSTDLRYGSTEVDVILDGCYYSEGMGEDLTVTIEGTPFTVAAVNDLEIDYDSPGSSTETGYPYKCNHTNAQNLVNAIQGDAGYANAAYTVELGVQEWSQVAAMTDIRARVHIKVISKTNESITVSVGTSGDTGITLDTETVSDANDYLTISENLGTTTQAADAMLLADLPDYVTVNHRARGICYLALKLTWNPDIWYTGIPQIAAVVHGVNQIYDPRDLSTGWSDNPALIVRWLLTHPEGMNVPTSRIDDQSFIDAANVCDYVVANGPSASGKRFTCNGSFTRDEKPKDIMSAVLSCMGGRLTYWNGKYRVHAAAYDSPSITITEDDLRGPVTLQIRTARRDLFNSVRGTFVDPDKDWQATDYPPVTNATYVTQDDGDTIWGDLSLPFTIDPWEAQRLAKIELERCRRGMTLQLQCKWTVLNVRVWDTVTFTSAQFGWSKVFRVVAMSVDMMNGPNLTLREEEPEIYDWDTSDGDAIPDPTNPDDPGGTTPDGTLEPPSNLSYEIINYTVTACVRLAMTPSPSAFATDYEVQYRLSADAEWSQTIPYQNLYTSLTDVQIVFCGVPAGNYIVRVRAVNKTNGTASKWVEAAVRINFPALNYSPNVSGLELANGANATQFIVKDPKFVWRKASGTNSNGSDFYFDYYEVRFLDGQYPIFTARTVAEEIVVPYQDNVREYERLNGTWGAYRQFTVAVYAVGTEGQMSQLPAKITVSNPAPELPTNITVSADAGGFVDVSWTPPGDPDWAGTLAWASTTSGFGISGTEKGSGNCVFDGADTSVRVAGLTPGETYYFKFASYDVYGKTGLIVSDQYSVTIPTFDPNDTTAPATPTGVSLSTGLVNTSQASLAYIEASWNANAETDLGGYILRVGRQGSTNWTTLAGITEIRLTKDTTRFRWEDAIPGVGYEGKIAAVDQVGNISAWSSLFTQTAQTDTSAPSAPTGVSLTAVVRSLYLTFTGVSDADLAYYEVYASTSSGFTPDTSTFSNLYYRGLGTALTYENASDATYYVKICAVDHSGNRSSFTTQVSATIAKVSGSQIGSSTVTGSNIGSSTVEKTNMANDSVGTNQIEAGAVTNTRIAAGTIETSRRSSLTTFTYGWGPTAGTPGQLDFGAQAHGFGKIPIGLFTTGNKNVALWLYALDATNASIAGYDFVGTQSGTITVYQW